MIRSEDASTESRYHVILRHSKLLSAPQLCSRSYDENDLDPLDLRLFELERSAKKFYENLSLGHTRAKADRTWGCHLVGKSRIMSKSTRALGTLH